MDDLTKIERDKYLKVWQHNEYRKVSPGMKEVARAVDYFDIKAGDSLVDLGSGPCRATRAFQDMGVRVLAVDFADNAREEDVPFLEACLWDLPDDVPTYDFGFCTDVMEHIPTEKVDEVLTNVAACSNIGTYFRIATAPDKMGKLIGEPLHLTVKDAKWWARKIGEYFEIVDVIEISKRDVVIGAKH